MTTPAEREAEKASIAFQMALTRIGAATIEDALKLWADMPRTVTAAASARWLGQAIHLIMTRRRLSRALAMAYYRLVRALRTGSTIADPRRPDPPYVTLDMLRREFALLAGPEAPLEGAQAPSQGAGTPEPDSTRSGQQDRGNDIPEADRITVEQIDGTRERQDRLERNAEREARVVLTVLGPNNLNRKVRDLDLDQPASVVDEERKKAHDEAGTRQAAAAERVVMDAARSQIWDLVENDERAIGYIRLSRTGTPCGWCAMLISRGPVYRSARSAEYADGDKYHDNCHCYSEPVFSRGQYSSSALYELNRLYARWWPIVTKGLSGKAAVSAWRRFIREQRKDAQAASQQTNVQEA